MSSSSDEKGFLMMTGGWRERKGASESAGKGDRRRGLTPG